MAKIKVDKDKCIGCGTCAALCSNFEIKGGKAAVKKASVDTITCEKKAADSCPVDAISIE